jgi:hypothetical protein
MVTLQKNQTLWAIGGKGWVEIRACRVPPKPVHSYFTTSCMREVKEVERVPQEGGGAVYRNIVKQMEQKVRLKTTTFKGGTILGTLHDCPRGLKFYVKKDECKQFNAEQTKVILKALEVRLG